MTDIVGFEKNAFESGFVEVADSALHTITTVQNQSIKDPLRLVIAADKATADASLDFYVIKAGDERLFSDYSGKLFISFANPKSYVKAVALRS